MTSEEQGHLKIAHSHWTPPYRIKWQEGTPVWCSCSKNRKCPRSRLEPSAREGRGGGARRECVTEEWATQSADPGVSSLTLFWELFSTHDPRKWLKKWSSDLWVAGQLLAWPGLLFLTLQVSWLTKLCHHKIEGMPGKLRGASGGRRPCLGR